MTVPNVLKEESNKHARQKFILKTLIFKEDQNFLNKTTQKLMKKASTRKLKKTFSRATSKELGSPNTPLKKKSPLTR
jgi:hypothetical protein